MGSDVENTYVYLKNASNAVEVRHYGPGGNLLDVSGYAPNPTEVWFRHHLGNASIDETSPKADASAFKTAALASDMVASLNAQGEDELADWMEASPQGTSWISAHGHPAAEEWANT